MPVEDESGRLHSVLPAAAPDDAFLIASIARGDDSALRAMIARYDRLVRFSIFRAARARCARDPEFLDAVASATWVGFVQSVRKAPDSPPTSVRAYLTLVARNQCVSALRRDKLDAAAFQIDAPGTAELADPLDEPAELLVALDDLTALRRCLADCAPDDRTLLSQLQAITERRWRDAAAALNVKESTLRSRWDRLLDRLRAAMRKKTVDSVAPPPPGRDSLGRKDP